MIGKVGVDYVHRFFVRTGAGAARTGLVAGDFAAVVIDPAGTAFNTPTVSEVSAASAPGAYQLTIPNGFTTANGVGEYGVSVRVTTAPLDGEAWTIPFHLRDFDDLAQPGDAMDLVAGAVDATSVATDAIDADALATDAVNEIRDGVRDLTVDGTITLVIALRALVSELVGRASRAAGTGGSVDVTYRKQDDTTNYVINKTATARTTTTAPT